LTTIGCAYAGFGVQPLQRRIDALVTMKRQESLIYTSGGERDLNELDILLEEYIQILEENARV